MQIKPREVPCDRKNAEEMAKLFASKIPKITTYNNIKSRKYFSSNSSISKFEEGEVSSNNFNISNFNTNTKTVKDKLLYASSNSFSEITTPNKKESLSSNILPVIEKKQIIVNSSSIQFSNNKKPTIYTKHRKNSSNILKVSKEILKFAEFHSTPKILYKIPAKNIQEEEDLNIPSDESDEEELSLNLNLIDITETIQNKHNKTVDNVCVNTIEDSICIVVKEKLNNTDIDSLNSPAGNKMRINFEALLKIWNIYSVMVKDLENKKIDYESLIVKYFEIIIYSYDSIYILEKTIINTNKTINDKSENDLKKYFKIEIIFLSLFLFYKRERDRGDNSSVNIMNAFKTCLFYLHQNLIILLFICNVIHKKNISNINNNASNEYEKDSIANEMSVVSVTAKVEENKIWLNKNNYKKYLRNNNKSVLGIIRNILKQIKIEQKEIEKEKEKEYTVSGSNTNNSNKGNIFGIIINYLQNISKFKIEVIRDKLFKNLMCEKFLTDSNLIVEINANDQQGDESTEGDMIANNNPNNNNNICQNTNKINNISINIIPPSAPFLPEKINFSKKYTLVLDLDETLVHYVEDEDSAYIQIRPGAENFLEEMFEFYEIIVFTAAMQDYADLVLDELDKNKRVSYRLYRQHTLNVDSFYLKDLSKLGRNLSKTLIIDNVADNFKFQPNNGIHIKNFEGDENDMEFFELSEDLKNIVRFDIDVRDALPKIIEKMIIRKNSELEDIYINNNGNEHENVNTPSKFFDKKSNDDDHNYNINEVISKT